MHAKKWIIIGAAGTLGLGILAGGAAAVADTLDLRDVQGGISSVQPVVSNNGTSTDGTSTDGTQDAVAPTSSPVSTQSPASPMSTPSPVSPVSTPSPVSAVSAQSPVSAQSAASTASVASADSPN
ncbi:hypothetical protein [Agromyces humatus]|uniref:Uncharacterized protein n=1 Tax=Agromyces humatus TaxID=279573 RepID=A0ABP4X4Z3_9MICO|nr:hypothetical protein [Agromyces humatus]